MRWKEPKVRELRNPRESSCEDGLWGPGTGGQIQAGEGRWSERKAQGPRNSKDEQQLLLECRMLGLPAVPEDILLECDLCILRVFFYFPIRSGTGQFLLDYVEITTPKTECLTMIKVTFFMFFVTWGQRGLCLWCFHLASSFGSSPSSVRWPCVPACPGWPSITVNSAPSGSVPV